MKFTTSLTRFSGRKTTLLTAAAIAALGGALFAAPQPAPLINPMGDSRASVSVPKGEGLDGLDDRALGAELSGRGIGNLLDRYFKVNRVPESDQRAIKTVGALNELRTNKNIPYGEKLRRVREVADGIDAVLPNLKDPLMMMATAATLIEFGVNQDVNSLEYWGEDPVTQSQLKPMAAAVVKLLDTAAKVAQQQADTLANQLRGGNDPNADKWEKLDGFAHTAVYSKQMSVYFEALATPAKDPSRKTMAEETIKALKDYDTPDSGVQPRIRNMLAKLSMVSGDFAGAKAKFVSVYEDKAKVVPAPNPYEQYEARYFAVVTDILNKDLATATTDKAALDAWQAADFPKLLADAKVGPAAISDTQKSVGAAGEMLQWRVHVLEGDLAKAGTPEKAKADTAAETVLLRLRTSHPELAGRIDQQLVNRMPANKVIDDKVAPSLLLALLQKGMAESFKTDLEKPDPVIINKGIEAALAIINRKDQVGLSPQNVSSAHFSIAILQDRLGKKVEAINSYLDYAIATYKTEPKKAQEAFDRAGFMVFDTKKSAVQPAGFEAVYNRFLPIAIAEPFNYKKLAYLYAEQLRGTRDYKEALKYYRLVPNTDPAFGAATFKQMIVLDSLLDSKQEPAEHVQTVKEMKESAAAVKKLYENSTEQFDRRKAVQAVLMLADLSRIEDKDPATTLKVLDGFETLIKGLPGEEELLRSAINARVNSYIALGQSDKAVGLLTKLLEGSKGDQGIAQVRALLDQLDAEFRKADVVHDTAKMRLTATNEAMLTHYLVDWSNPKTQKNANISQYYYSYAAYDADRQRVAGGLAADAASRKALLQKAADLYRYLQTPEMHNLYIQSAAVKKRIADKQADPAEPDSNVAAGLALTSFDLGDYVTARDQLDVLISNKKLGTPQSEVIDEKTGEAKIKDNDLYWEATYKFVKSAHEAAKGNAKLEDVAIRNLKNILIRGGIPERWQDEFEGLTKEMIPGFNPGILAAPQKPATPGAPATTQPAAGPTAAAPPAMFRK